MEKVKESAAKIKTIAPDNLGDALLGSRTVKLYQRIGAMSRTRYIAIPTH